MYCDVIEVKVAGDLALYVRFNDDTDGYVGFMRNFLSGFAEPLNNPQFFNRVFIDSGIVSWPNGIKLASDTIYQEIKENGEWFIW